MFAIQFSRRLFPLILLVIPTFIPLKPLQAEEKLGLKVGETVPRSSMRPVVGNKLEERNTCLAGRYRDKRTISIYVRSLEEPGFGAFLKKINALVAANQELRAYVLLSGNQFDGELKTRIRAWAKDQALTNVDIAIANGSPDPTLRLNDLEGTIVVYSDRLLVKYRRDIPGKKLNEKMATEVVGELEKTAKKE